MTAITLGSTIQYSDDAYAVAYNGAPAAKLKEITVRDSYTGSWRIVFDYACCDNYGAGAECYRSPVYFQLYKNGSPYGTFITTTTCDWTINQTQDFTGISIANGDKIQIYAYMSDAAGDTSVSVQNFRIEFSGPSGNASFASSPSGATIWVDGVNTGVTTPGTVTGIAAGPGHTYTLKLAGYYDATGSFSITSALTTTVPTVTLTPSVITGNASFTSVPSGATIWIDGTSTSVTTPNTIANLSAGSHNYTLKLTGYYDASGSFSVTGGSTTTVPTVTFSPSLYITSIPSGASIYIDTIPQGVNTPTTITNLSVGSHTYRLVFAGYNVSSGNFTTTGGQTTNISIILSGTATAFLSAGD